MTKVKLTKYSHGAGCGCKISPKVLSEILQTNIPIIPDERLIVGNDTRDDAAVYDMGNGTAIISTTDFFMPIVDDPFTYGKIAATNAISDIYAMGGTPLLAIAILGWPIDKLSPAVAREVLEGGREACKEAGILLAGGHSIDSPEPIFGLAVTGSVKIDELKKNDTAKLGARLYLTKPLGVGILTTAQKKGVLKPNDEHLAPNSMMKPNSIGQKLARISGVTAMTDVTGFGLLGHLTELCQGSGLSAQINYEAIPKINGIDFYIEKDCIPGGTHRNWDSYGEDIKLSNKEMKVVLCDPQTSGGLLIAVDPNSTNEVELLLKENNIEATCFGSLIKQSNPLINVT
tara:strand:+ start:186 stop:1217 length:1032 start_codon:yes stop_codon:yes gene_type:complete